MSQCPERVFGERLQGLMAHLGQGHDFTLNFCPSPQTILSGQLSRWMSFWGVCLEITIQKRWGGPPPLHPPFHLHCWESSSATRSGLSGCRGHMGSFAYRGQQTWANSTWPSLSPVRGRGGVIYIKMWFLQAGPSRMADPFMHVSCNANQFPHQRGSRKPQMFGVYFANIIWYFMHNVHTLEKWVTLISRQAVAF